MKSLVVLGVVSLLGLSLILLACGGGSTPAPTAIAYVAHPQSHSLTVINIPANKTVSRIEIGNSSSGSLTQVPSYPQSIVITPDGSRAYVSDGFASVWIVDTASNSAIGKIDAGMEPEALVMSPDGRSIYGLSITCGDLLCSGPSKPAQMASVEVIDTASSSLKATITFGKTPDVVLSGIAISPDGSRVYVSEFLGPRIWVIDTATNGIVADISTARSGFSDVAISPDGKSLYALGATHGAAGASFGVDVIDTQTNTVSASIPLGNEDETVRIAVAPDGAHAYVTGGAGLFWVIDTVKNAVLASIKVSFPNPLLGVAVTPDSTRAYIACGNTGTIFVLDTTTNSVIDTVRTDYPSNMTIARAK